MMQKAAIFPLVLAMCGSAHADWQYTRWGMSHEDVAAAAKGALSLSSDSDTAPLLEGSYKVGNRTFDMRAHFDANDRLKMIELHSQDLGECGQTLDDLRKKYGAPQDSAPGRITSYTWNDSASGNRIKFLDFSNMTLLAKPGKLPNKCSLTYEPLGNVEPGL